MATTDKRWQGFDPVFLHRSQIGLGVVLTYYGRINHGAQWKVTAIYTVTDTGRRKQRASVERSDDTITLQRIGSNETRSAGFMYLSYSAIWRIGEG